MQLYSVYCSQANIEHFISSEGEEEIYKWYENTTPHKMAEYKLYQSALD
jgi:hypothetical protein